MQQEEQGRRKAAANIVFDLLNHTCLITSGKYTLLLNLAEVPLGLMLICHRKRQCIILLTGVLSISSSRSQGLMLSIIAFINNRGVHIFQSDVVKTKMDEPNKF